MDVISLGMQALEGAIHTGSQMVDAANHLVQAATTAGTSDVPITCEICKCEWQ
jgi:hypothetical protein